MGLFAPSNNELIEMFKDSWEEHVKSMFASIVKEAKESQKQKYTIDLSGLEQFANIVKGYKANEIQRGIEMQYEKGSQNDWAIAGGIASGLLGGAAGTAVAINTMQENIESTRKHHERGQKMVENGINGIESINRSMEKVNKIAADINRNEYYEYTNVIPNLLNSFEFENVSIITNETTELHKVTTFGGLKTYKINDLIAYNAIGFFKANISLKNNFHKLFPEEKNKVIDGSFKISLYDGEKEIGYSYISGDNWSVDELEKVGFKEKIECKKIFKLVNKNIEIIPGKKYIAKFSQPNLWLVMPR